MSYDTKCYELAKAFLSDIPADAALRQEAGSFEKVASELAQQIQDTIEDFFIERNLS